MTELDHSGRENVIKFLGAWQAYLDKYGKERTRQWLIRGTQEHLTKEDRIGLAQALGMVL